MSFTRKMKRCGDGKPGNHPTAIADKKVRAQWNDYEENIAKKDETIQELEQQVKDGQEKLQAQEARHQEELNNLLHRPASRSDSDVSTIVLDGNADKEIQKTVQESV